MKSLRHRGLISLSFALVLAALQPSIAGPNQRSDKLGRDAGSFDSMRAQEERLIKLEDRIDDLTGAREWVGNASEP